MLDIKRFRENPEIVRENLKRRGEETTPVDQVIAYDKKWRELLQEVETLKRERNLVTQEVAKLKKENKDASELIKKMKGIPEEIKKLEAESEKFKIQRNSLLETLPNIMHESVPFGEDDTKNVELRTWGKIPQFKFKPKDHIDLGEALDLIDIERAAKTSGARFYFLKGDLALMELAIAQYAMNELKKEGFTNILPPVLVRENVMYGVGMLPMSKDEIYKIEGEDLYLVLTAEHALGGYFMDEIVEESQLPIRFAGFSSCFRTEAGAHGRDTKGIFRVHQFQKVELFEFTTPETSWEEHESLLATAEKLVQGLGLPYRVSNICTGDLGKVAAKKYDIEAWFPGQDNYREIISCSNCTDYQARRLNARFRRKDGTIEHMHTLNSTALAIGRTIVAIMENYQNEDGSIDVPKVLIQYMGTKKIESK